ncbi:MAG: TRAP transporter large permease, partial [Eubacterium sp.]
SFSIMAIPFFILAGNLMTKGGISKRIVGFANSIIGNVRGAMGIAGVVACAFFAALSGSSPATVVAIGSMLYPEMVELGYPKERSAGIIAVAGGLGPIIPPSIVMIVFATATESSVAKLFTAGATCGIMIAVALIGMTIFIAHKEKWPKSNEKINVKDLGKKFVNALPALLLPVIVMGGIFSGLFTPTESAVISVVYALVVSLFIYKDIKIKDLFEIFVDSAKGSAMILFIMATSTAFAWVFTYAGISDSIVQLIIGMNLGKTMFLLLIAIVLLIFGTFLEGIATTLLLIPVFFPIATTLGIDPIHLGMVMSISTCVGAVTPPVAVNIFAASSFSKLSMGEIAKGEFPWFITMLVMFMLIVLIPGISLLFIG